MHSRSPCLVPAIRTANFFDILKPNVFIKVLYYSLKRSPHSDSALADFDLVGATGEEKVHNLGVNLVIDSYGGSMSQPFDKFNKLKV